MNEPVAKEVCEHYWAWVSPAGAKKAARLCMNCCDPSAEWLNSIIDVQDLNTALKDILKTVEKNWVWIGMPQHASHVYQRGYEQALKDVREEMDKL